MKPSSVFTRKRMGLDYNVWLSMLLLMFLSLGLLAYKIIDNKKIKPCSPLIIFVNGSATKNKFYDAGEHLFFKAGVSLQTDNITWDFGDNTRTEQGYTTSHIFKRTGTFAITAVVNGNCLNTANVTIIKPVEITRDSIGNTVENIIGNDAVKAGLNIVYSTPLTAGSYDWSVINNSYYQPRQGKQTAFKFKSGGIYTILLILDHDKNKSYTKDIIVSDTTVSAKPTNSDFEKPTKLIPDYPIIIPNNNNTNQNQQAQNQPSQPAQNQATQNQPASEPEKHKISITDKQLKLMLQQVVSNAMHAPDFDRYFCSGVNTKVYVNNEKVPVSFSDLCQQQLQGRKIEIELAHIVTDPDNPNCETNILVKYKKTGGFLKKIF